MSQPVPALPHRALAEAIGTFALVFAGCGAIVVNAQTGALGHLGVCAVFGLVVGAMIFATGHLSGAHFNPAVTVAFAATGRFPWREAPAYIGAQLGAAVLGAGLLALVVGTEAQLGATLPAVGAGPAVVLELVLTFFLMFVIQAVATDGRAAGSLAAVAIGATVALCALMGGPLTGASMNPARSLGPALVAGILEGRGVGGLGFAGQWVFLAGPLLGALAGAFAYEAVRGQAPG